MIDKEAIKKNFSRYAGYYDRYSDTQNLCALKLINRIETNDFLKILDVGCGTGNYTKFLRGKFPAARIKAVDISQAMVGIAREKLKGEEIEFVVADGETIEFKERFDLISSNVSFQWFEDLRKALARYKKLLNKNGLILFSLFGPLTFSELDSALKKVLGEDKEITAYNFIKKQRIEGILKGLFNKVKVEEEILRKRYSSLSELLRAIKYTGTKGNGITRSLWTPKAMHRLEKIYRKEFSHPSGAPYTEEGIVATYQIFFCKGMK